MSKDASAGETELPGAPDPPGSAHSEHLADPQRQRLLSAMDELAAPPQQIGRYRILSSIGEGGMGEVYKAEQREPIHRIVALKVIKLGMDTKEVIARFEGERQAL